MANNSNRPPLDGWNEYKRLVLAELERLTQATEKLKDQSIECQKEIADDLIKFKETIYTRIANKQRESAENIEKIAEILKKEIHDLEQQLNSYKERQQEDTTVTSKWGFWASVISIAGSLIVAIISLFIALN